MAAGCIGIDASRAISAAPTGTEGYSYHLIQALLPYLTPRHTVRLYFREPPPLGAFPHAELCSIPFPRLWTHLRLSAELWQHPPDLLFVPAHVLPPVRPARTLVTVHDLGYRAFPQAHTARQRLYLELSTRWNVRVATHILADSQATREALVEAYHVPLEKITVVYPGYDQQLQPERDPAVVAGVRARYEIPGPYILSLGSIQPRKNLTRLVAAFAQLAPRYPELTLVLAGPPGWLVEPLHARVRELGLEQRVRFPGYVGAEDKAALLSGAELFVFPSLYEGFGFPVLEAQACEVPVLASNTTSLPEVAGEAALLVNPLDETAIVRGLGRLLEDVALRQQLIARGKANLTRFSWQQAGQTVTILIERLLSEPGDGKKSIVDNNPSYPK
ncbi:MAG: glycosyltransferase family 1 protein [Chloroflexota bacterium]|nr:glycosyltransferase family 1 protein [Chloroflexota bacterium]